MKEIRAHGAAMNTPSVRIEPPKPTAPVPAEPAGPSLLTYLAALISVAGLAGTLYLSIGMGLKACPLCLYERVFMMAVFAVLCLGLVFQSTSAGLLSSLSMPLAVGGLALALFHCDIERKAVIECPVGVSRFIEDQVEKYIPSSPVKTLTAPQESAVAFGLIVLLLLLDLLFYDRRPFAWLVQIAIGIGLAYGCIKSSPPLPPRTTPYEVNVNDDGCRPVFKMPDEAAPKVDAKKNDVTKNGAKVDGAKVDGAKVDGAKVDAPMIDRGNADAKKNDAPKIEGKKNDAK